MNNLDDELPSGVLSMPHVHPNDFLSVSTSGQEGIEENDTEEFTPENHFDDISLERSDFDSVLNHRQVSHHSSEDSLESFLFPNSNTLPNQNWSNGNNIFQDNYSRLSNQFSSSPLAGIVGVQSQPPYNRTANNNDEQSIDLNTPAPSTNSQVCITIHYSSILSAARVSY